MKIEGALDPTRASGAVAPEGPSGIASPAEGAGPDFAGILEKTVEGANRLQKVADASAAAFARGATDDLHGTMISAKEADISLKLVGTVRNRLLDAFHELWRINL